jgi:hypothetical protein
MLTAVIYQCVLLFPMQPAAQHSTAQHSTYAGTRASLPFRRRYGRRQVPTSACNVYKACLWWLVLVHPPAHFSHASRLPRAGAGVLALGAALPARSLPFGRRYGRRQVPMLAGVRLLATQVPRWHLCIITRHSSCQIYIRVTVQLDCHDQL